VIAVSRSPLEGDRQLLAGENCAGPLARRFFTFIVFARKSGQSSLYSFVQDKSWMLAEPVIGPAKGRTRWRA
jgi:hypothetical protein